MKPDRTRTSSIIWITVISLAVNCILILLKGFVGYAGGSQALLADALHSLSDFLSDGIIIAGILAASRPVDRSHRYGHGKFETLATSILGLFLFAASGSIFYTSGKELIGFSHGEIIAIPAPSVLLVAGISIAAKEILYHVTIVFSKRHKSPSLLANAWHHRSDALSSVAVLIGSGCSRLFGEAWAFLDPAAGILVGLMVVKVAFNITRESIDELLEKSLCESVEEEIMSVIRSVQGAEHPHRLRTRKIGSGIVVDVHVLVAPELNIVEAHDIASHVENSLIRHYGSGTIVSVHIEPDIQRERDGNDPPAES